MVLAQGAPHSVQRGNVTPLAQFNRTLSETQGGFESASVFDMLIDWRFLVGLVLVVAIAGLFWWMRGRDTSMGLRVSMVVAMVCGVASMGWATAVTFSGGDEQQLVAAHKKVYVEAIEANKDHLFAGLDEWYTQTDMTSKEVCASPLKSTTRAGVITDPSVGLSTMVTEERIGSEKLLQCGGDQPGVVIAPIGHGNVGGGLTRAVVTTVADDGIYIETFDVDLATGSEFEGNQNRNQAIDSLTRAIANEAVPMW